MYGDPLSHRFTPSKAMPVPSALPAPKVPSILPSLARTLVPVPPPFGTQMFAPSKARVSKPPRDTLNVPAVFPSSFEATHGTIEIRDPHISPVADNVDRSTVVWERAQYFPVAGPQLGD